MTAPHRLPSSIGAPTLEQLLALDDLPEFEIIGGAGALRTPVTGVIAGTSTRNLSEDVEGALIVFERRHLQLEDPQADLGIRLAHSSGVAGIIAERPPGAIPLATARLADKFGVPVVVLESVQAAPLVARLDLFVRAPEIAGARAVERFTRRIQQTHNGSDELFAAIRDAVDTPIALVDTEGRVLQGDPDALASAPLDELSVLCSRPRPTPSILACPNGDTLLLQPALAPWTGAAELWFVARVTEKALSRSRTAEQVLAIASLAFSARFSRDALVVERDNRERALLLTEILDQATSPRRSTIERATSLGWRLTGWHMGVHVMLTRPPDDQRAPSIASELEAMLAAAGVTASLVEKPDGWVFWVSTDHEPKAAESLALAKGVRRALLATESADSGTKLHAGVGRPYLGTEGIQRSLKEARQGCLLAQTSEVPAAVEHVDAMNVAGLLAGWYNSEPVRESAQQLLAPLLEADPSGELIRTLRCYLDHESSATTTALVLGIHRNTVIQRLTRIRSVLPLDLLRPDERLVAHLATRGTDVQWDESTPAPLKPTQHNAQ